MYISDLYPVKKPTLSLEIFPPKKENAESDLFAILESVSSLEPDFISVTYGASGTMETRKKSEMIAGLLKNEYHAEPLFHLTCINNTKDEIKTILHELNQNNIQNILALRGDKPTDANIELPTDFSYAVDLIQTIKESGDFCVGAACYPEGHIDQESHENDFKHLYEKQQAGADFFISQLFFENRFFLNFRDEAHKVGITKPLIAGIMPILGKSQINRMIFMCGASLPSEIIKMLHKYEDKPEDLKLAGMEYSFCQAEELIREGVDGIHFYTMNKPAIAKASIERLR